MLVTGTKYLTDHDDYLNEYFKAITHCATLEMQTTGLLATFRSHTARLELKNMQLQPKPFNSSGLMHCPHFVQSVLKMGCSMGKTCTLPAAACISCVLCNILLAVQFRDMLWRTKLNCSCTLSVMQKKLFQVHSPVSPRRGAYRPSE